MKTLVITGANRGLGLEFVHQYLADGWQVVAGCRSPESAKELNALQEQGNLMVLPLDVSKQASRESFCRALGDMAVHLFINNAGVYGPTSTPLGKVDEEQWLEVLRINTVAPVKMIELLRKNLVNAEAATIAILSSKMGSIDDNGSGGLYMYRSSKSAVNSVTKSLAIDLAEDHIHVVALHPGWVLTDMGGPNALIDAATSVGGMRRVLANLKKEQSGQFIAYDGTHIAW